MAKVKAYPKGSTTAIEWEIHPDTEAVTVLEALNEAVGSTFIKIRTVDGHLLLDPSTYTSFEVTG